MLLPKYEKMSELDLASCIEREEVNVNDISLLKRKQREAFFTAIKKRPILLTKIKEEKVEDLLFPTLEKYPASFVYLNKEQYTEELAQKFLLFRLMEAEKKVSPNVVKDLSFSVQSSFDNKVLLNYSYVTQDGEEVYYFDNELQVPSSLKYCYKATLKVVNALSLINKLDLHITQLGRNKIKNTLTDIFNNKFKVFISEYISKNKCGYYSLCANIGILEEEFKNSIVKSFTDYGIELGEFIIKRFAIPKDIQYKIEDQALQIRQLKADNEASNEFAKKSLENYEAKLAIESKYPGGEYSLTEYEKDLALKRFLIKNGVEVNGNIDHGIGIKENKEKVDATIDKKADVVPDIPKKVNKARIAYFTMLGICAFIALILLASELSAGLIFSGICVAIFGLIGVFFYDKIKVQKIEITNEDLGNSNSSNNNTETK